MGLVRLGGAPPSVLEDGRYNEVSGSVHPPAHRMIHFNKDAELGAALARFTA